MCNMCLTAGCRSRATCCSCRLQRWRQAPLTCPARSSPESNPSTCQRHRIKPQVHARDTGSTPNTCDRHTPRHCQRETAQSRVTGTGRQSCDVSLAQGVASPPPSRAASRGDPRLCHAHRQTRSPNLDLALVFCNLRKCTPTVFARVLIVLPNLVTSDPQCECRAIFQPHVPFPVRVRAMATIIYLTQRE